MKIDNNYNISINKNQSFKALRLSFDIQNNLELHKIKFPITHLIKVGKKLENTQYFDLLILKDMKPQIREKGNLFSAITEPVKIERNENQLKITGIYDGIDNEQHKKGDTIDYIIDFEDSGDAYDAEKKAGKLNDIVRLSYITRLLDDYTVNKNLEKHLFPTRESLIDFLMCKYGDIVK